MGTHLVGVWPRQLSVLRLTLSTAAAAVLTQRGLFPQVQRVRVGGNLLLKKHSCRVFRMQLLRCSTNNIAVCLNSSRGRVRNIHTSGVNATQVW